MTVVRDTGRTTALGLLPELAPRWQLWLVRAACLESLISTAMWLAGRGPLIPDPLASMPSPILLAETAALAVFFGWPFLAERLGWFS